MTLYYDSATDAARAAGVSDTTILGRIQAGEIPGAYRSSDGWWRVPVDGMREAGYQVTGEGAHAVGPYDRKLPEPTMTGEDGYAVWNLEHIDISAETECQTVYVDGNDITPKEAREEAAALLAAADHAEGVGRADA